MAVRRTVGSFQLVFQFHTNRICHVSVKLKRLGSFRLRLRCFAHEFNETWTALRIFGASQCRLGQRFRRGRDLAQPHHAQAHAPMAMARRCATCI